MPELIFNKFASRQLAKSIQNWWRKKGQNVSVWVEEQEVERVNNEPTTMYVIRSDIGFSWDSEKESYYFARKEVAHGV